MTFYAAVPGKPVGPIKFTKILADSVTLSWSPPKKDGGSKVISYIVDLSNDGVGNWTETGTVEATKTIFTATDLKEGEKYDFRVSAVNDVGRSAPLESDTVTPQRQISKRCKYCDRTIQSMSQTHHHCYFKRPLNL